MNETKSRCHGTSSRARRVEVSALNVSPIRILVADDHAFIREGVRSYLCSCGMTVVGEATTGCEAWELATRLRPDVVVMDIRMPEMSGLEALRCIRQDLPGTPVILMTAFEIEPFERESKENGAFGFVLKTGQQQVLKEMILAAFGRGRA